MLIINVLCLMATCFVVGYFIGKGKVEIVKQVKLDTETKERIDKQLKEQEQAIQTYNDMCNALNYQ